MRKWVVDSVGHTIKGVGLYIAVAIGSFLKTYLSAACNVTVSNTGQVFSRLHYIESMYSLSTLGGNVLNLNPKPNLQPKLQTVNLNTNVWKLLKKAKRNHRSHKKYHHYFQNKRRQDESRIANHPHSRRRRRICSTTTMMLLQWQTAYIWPV